MLTSLPSRFYLAVMVLAGGSLLACSRSPSDQPATTSGGGQPMPVMVADFRQVPASLHIPAQEEQAIITAVLGAGVPASFHINDLAVGSFTQPHAEQTLYLIAKRDAVAADPQAQPPMLALYEHEHLITQFVPGESAYRNFAAVVDIDHDGTDEVILSADFYNMGTALTAADLYGFADGKRSLIQTLGTVYENSCEAPVGDRRLSASVLSQDDANQQLLASQYTAACSSQSKPDWQLVE